MSRQGWFVIEGASASVDDENTIHDNYNMQ